MQSPRAAVGIDFLEGRSFACWDSIETFPNLREDELSLLALRVLLFDPIVGVTQSDIQTSARLPFQHLLDKSIVAIAASHTARRFEIIFSAQFYLAIASTMITSVSIVTSSDEPRLIGVATKSSQCMIVSMPLSRNRQCT